MSAKIHRARDHPKLCGFSFSIEKVTHAPQNKPSRIKTVEVIPRWVWLLRFSRWKKVLLAAGFNADLYAEMLQAVLDQLLVCSIIIYFWGCWTTGEKEIC